MKFSKQIRLKTKSYCSKFTNNVASQTYLALCCCIFAQTGHNQTCLDLGVCLGSKGQDFSGCDTGQIPGADRSGGVHPHMTSEIRHVWCMTFAFKFQDPDHS